MTVRPNNVYPEVINDQDSDFGAVEHSPEMVDTQSPSQPSCRIDLDTLQHLDPQLRKSLLSILDDFADVFSDSQVFVLW